MDRIGTRARRRSRRIFLEGSLALAGLTCLSACGLAPIVPKPATVPRIGLFHVGLDHVPPSLETFRDELRSIGYSEGKDVHLDWRNLADEAAANATAREFVRDRVDMIVAFENQTVRAAKAATTEIPILMLHSEEPVLNGFVQSFAHPGGNITGFAGGPVGALAAKRIEFFKQLVPTMRRLLVLIDPEDPTSPRQLVEARRAGAALQIELIERDAVVQADVERVFRELRPGEAEGVYPLSPNLQVKFTSLLIQLGTQASVPVMAYRKEWVEQGALLSYGPDISPAGRAAAQYVDRILKGTKPADLPIGLADVVELVVNLKVARTLGLNVSPSVLEQADHVVK